MPPTHRIDFRPTDPQEKKIAVLAVISFNDANSVPFSRIKVSEYFGIHERTARKWCADGATATASTSTSRPAQGSDNNPENQGSKGIKRARSEDIMAEILSASVTSGPHKSQKPGQNGGQGRKKRKADLKQEVLTPTPPPPQQLLTPPRRKISQPRKRRQTESTESSIHGWNSEECGEV